MGEGHVTMPEALWRQVQEYLLAATPPAGVSLRAAVDLVNAVGALPVERADARPMVVKEQP